MIVLGALGTPQVHTCYSYLSGRLPIFRASSLVLSSIQTHFSSATWLTYLADVPHPELPELSRSPSQRSLTSHTSRTFSCTIMATSSMLLWTLFTPYGRRNHSAAELREVVCVHDLHQLQDPQASHRTTQTTTPMRISPHLSIPYLLSFFLYFQTIRIYAWTYSIIIWLETIYFLIFMCVWNI